MSSITSAEFKNRRYTLMQQMGEGSIAIVMAAPERLRSADSHYPYHQSTNFHYLTGFDEPYAAAVFVPGRKEGEFIFFNQTNQPELEIWIGKRIGQEGACRDYGADEAHPIEKLDELMPKLMQGKEKLYYSFGMCPKFDQQVGGWLNQLRRNVRGGVGVPEQVVNLNQLVFEMRLIKSEAEINIMRHIGELSAKAHIAGMKASRTAQYEYQVEAEIWHYLAMNGCGAWAYNPIVGAGINACVLHYNENNQPLKQGDLLLVDAGGEWEGYAADITRTYPINGKFSAEQKAIYELVLASQKVGIDAVQVGTLYNGMHQKVVRVLTEGLIDLGLLKGSVDECIEKETYKAFFMHNTGHWLGLDVHDVGVYKIKDEWRPLEAGMVLTIEPGLYIKENTPNVDSKWWNIGVRIEDDVLVTKNGPEVLTKAVPKEVADIEALMSV
jgi:Xaa-Pro aminopeptidase